MYSVRSAFLFSSTRVCFSSANAHPFLLLVFKRHSITEMGWKMGVFDFFSNLFWWKIRVKFFEFMNVNYFKCFSKTKSWFCIRLNTWTTCNTFNFEVNLVLSVQYKRRLIKLGSSMNLFDLKKITFWKKHKTLFLNLHSNSIKKSSVSESIQN